MNIKYKYIKVNDWTKVPKEGAFEAEWSSGNKEWWLNGQQHRIDGPAIEYANGHKEWWLNGQQHRIDGPAIECASGDKAWYLNGKQHRIDGPAVEYASGAKAWWLNGKCYLTEKEYWLALLKHELISKEEAFERCLSL